MIRVGDRASLFNADMDWYFNEVAEILSLENEGFPFQRFLMGGGTCEATPFSLAGYPAFGMAFPLGNYHNMSLSGKIRPEFVALSDLFSGIRLLEGVATNLSLFKKRKIAYRSRLSSLYAGWKGSLLKTAREVKGQIKLGG